jgi:hypothetical protein
VIRLPLGSGRRYTLLRFLSRSGFDTAVLALSACGIFLRLFGSRGEVASSFLLFVRNSKTVELTEAGRAYVEGADE